MNKYFSSFFKILVSLFSLKYILCKQCPTITTYYHMRNDLGYVVRSFFQIPFTNVLIINTFLRATQNSSIVYYLDMQTRNGDVINVVSPEYTIVQMSYIYSQGKILVMNYDRMLIVHPYTLKSEGVLFMPQLVDAQMIGQTDYAVATLQFYVMYIIDVNLMAVVKTLDNTGFPNVLNTINFYTKNFQLLQLNPSQYIIITVNTYGFYSWTVDLFDFNAVYNGYIPVTIVNNTDYAYRQFVKHPTLDLFFIAAQNLEIVAFEIVNITTNTYRTQIKQNLYNSKYLLNATNIAYKSYSNYTGNPPILIIVDTSFFVYEIQLKYDNVNKTYSITNNNNPKNMREYPIILTWYEMNDDTDTRLVMNGDYFITVYNTYQNTNKTFYMLFIGSDNFSRRFLYEGKEKFFAFPRARSIQYFDKDYLGFQISFSSNMTLNPYKEENSYYIAKHCEECLFIKTYDLNQTQGHFMNIIIMYPRNNTFNKTLNITSLGFKWNEVNLNLDPFNYQNQTWVVLGFRNKPANKKFLFTLINMYDITKNAILTGDTDEENSRPSSYALASTDDPDNLEIIGVDLLGYLYVWDFLSPQVLKYSRKTSCLNSEIGVLYQYNKSKWIILACDNSKVLSYDFQKDTTQFISSVTKNPQSLKAYPKLGIIAIGDTVTGNVYIHKFKGSQFEYFLTIQPGGLKDNMISFELLKDNTIWVQYQYANLFYPLGECIDDVNNCLKCEQTFYFNTSLIINNSTTYNNATVYGNGTLLTPYTSPHNFLIAMLKAQRYQERISGVTSMNVNIIVDPQNIIKLPKGFLSFDFSSVIQLSIKSRIQNQLATLEYSGKLEFSNYNYVGFQDIRIQYLFSKTSNECGIKFHNITQNTTLNNIQLLAKNSQDKQNCFQINLDQTNIQILNLQIQNQDFSTHKSIFSTLYTDWIQIKNLLIDNCIFGDDFSIVKQDTNLIATIQSVKIINNKCVKDRTKEVTSLFSAGLFDVDDLLIKNNDFCNKIIFSSATSLEQQNYQFQFKQIKILENTFIAKTSYIFFNSLYSMIQQPSHSVIFQQMSIQSNSLQKINDDDLLNTSLIQTSKISNILFEDIFFNNHHEISFSQIEYSDRVQINNFYCVNDQDYFDISPNSNSGSCFELYEIQSTKINHIQIKNKKAYNNELISLQNKLFYSNSVFDLTDGEFSNMILKQYTINSFVNPLSVSSQNSLILTILNCHFFDNNLDIIESSQTFSTSALWVENLLGQVHIIDSTFKNSTSNSIYNFMYIQTVSLELHNLTFSRSSFGLESTKQLGGFMNLILNTLKIVDTSFSKSKSQYGSFIYIQAFGDLLIADIANTYFTEGYAEVDGGALYIDIKKSQLKFVCNVCFFNNIYTYSQGSSTIGFQKYRITTFNHIHEMLCQGGQILNIFGVGDNYFTDIFNMKLSLIDIKDIKPQITQSEELDTQMNENFRKIASQQSTLFSSQYSQIIIKGCQVNDYQILNKQSSIPLLINSDFTSVSIIDTIIQDSIFVNSAIKVTNGTLTLKNAQFRNIVQQKIIKSRLLFDSDDEQNNQISSLIIIKDSELKVYEETSFLGTKCYNNCTGAVFYLMNTNFDIQDMVISNSESAYGGSLFIQGLKQFNQIISSKFDNNKAYFDGGGIYLQALIDDSFKLKFENCIIQQNFAIFGKGGGLFIRSNSLNSTNQLIEIQDTQITGNTAEIGGGIYQKEISPKLLNTILNENVGKKFGNDTLSYPTHLQFVSMNQFFSMFDAKQIDNNTIVVSNYRSGDNLKGLSFQLANDQEEVIIPITPQEQQEFSVKVQISKNQNFQNYSIRGNISTSYDNENSQQFQLQEFGFIGIPGSSATLEFISDQIFVLDTNQANQYNQDYSFKIIIKFRNCIQGEAASVIGSLTECIVCQEGKFSFDLQECHTCPTGATCAGGAQLVADPGYWRNTNESSLLISCTQEENCIGGSFGNHICFEGHIGALCEECDISGMYWNNTYARSAKNTCTKCNEIAYNSWFVLLVTIWTLISMVLAIKGDISAKLEQGSFQANYRNQIRQKLNSQKNQVLSQSNQENIQNSTSKNQALMESSSITTNNNTSKNLQRSRNISIFGKKITSIFNVPLKKDKKVNDEGQKSSIYIKILTNYFQIVCSVATFDLNIPSGIFGIPSFAGQPLKNTVNSFDCFLKDYDTSIPFIYFRQIISFLIPFGYFFIFLIGIGLFHISNRKGKFPFYILSTAAMFLIIYVQPDLVSSLISLASCRQIGDKSYILGNVTYLCYTNEHYKYVIFFIIPSLTIWVLVLPLLLFSMLYKNRNNINKIKIKMIYGFLYKEYKKEAFYWEFVKMLEKILIILCLNFYSKEINVKAFLVFVIIVVYGILSIIIEPFEEQKINSLDNYSTTVCGISILLGLFIYQNPFSYFYYSSLGIMVLINVIFIFVIFKRIINAYLQKLQNILSNSLKKLALQIPILKKYLESKEERKKVNHVVKEKVKKIFENYLSLTIDEKQKMKMRILKTSFKFTLSNMFGDYDDNEDDEYEINQKSVQQQFVHDKKFNYFNSYEEQNNLLQRNQGLYPLSNSLYTGKDNDNENNQQKKARFKLYFNQDEKCTEKHKESEQYEIHTEETHGDSIISKNIPKNIKFLNSLNNQKTNEDLIQFNDEQNSPASLNYHFLFQPDKEQLITHYGDEIKTNDEVNEDYQQKRVKARQSVLDSFKFENQIIPKLEDQEKSDIHNKAPKIDVFIHQSKEIKYLYSLNDDLVFQGEIQQVKEKNEITQIEEKEKQDNQLDQEDIFQEDFQNKNNLILSQSADDYKNMKQNSFKSI